MQLYITLGLLCMVISEVVAHSCFHCLNETSSFCPYNESCPFDEICASRTEVDYENNNTIESYKRMCIPRHDCITGSINMGLYKKTMHTECCYSDFCNSQIVPEYENNMTNGYRCYTCEGADCTKELSCVGDEYSCITANNWNYNITLKGCISYDLCWYLKRMRSGINCCYGNLCNRDGNQHQSEEYYTDHPHHDDGHGEYDHDYDYYDYDYHNCDDIFCNSAKSVGQSVFLLLGSLISALL